MPASINHQIIKLATLASVKRTNDVTEISETGSTDNGCGNAYSALGKGGNQGQRNVTNRPW